MNIVCITQKTNKCEVATRAGDKVPNYFEIRLQIKLQFRRRMPSLVINRPNIHKKMNCKMSFVVNGISTAVSPFPLRFSSLVVYFFSFHYFPFFGLGVIYYSHTVLESTRLQYGKTKSFEETELVQLILNKSCTNNCAE